MLKGGGSVNLLLQPPGEMVDIQAHLQVIGIKLTTSKAGHHTVMFTLSDGNHFMDCFLSPKLFHLFDEHELTICDVVIVIKLQYSGRLTALQLLCWKCW